MKLAPEHRNALEEIAGKIAAELVLAEAGRDDGLIPCYSLVSELAERADDGDLILGAATIVQKALGDRLDAGKPWDEAAINLLMEFNCWAESITTESDQDGELNPFVPKGAGPAASEPARTAEPVAPAPTSAAPVPTAAPATPVEVDIPADLLEFDAVQEIDLDENRELLGEFHAEAVDHLGQIENALLQLEGDPSDADAINSIFRSFHTLKGVAGFLHLKPINKLAHEVESLLDLVRNGRLALHRGIVDVVLAGRDVIEHLVAQVNDALTTGRQPNNAIPISRLILDVRATARGEEAPQVAAVPAAVTPRPSSTAVAEEESAQDDASESGAVVPTIATAPDAKPATAKPSNDANTAARRSDTNTIRVHTFKLDNLMDMVGELVILQSQLVEAAKADGLESNTLSRTVNQLSRISKELQHTTMSLRMIPIKPTFHKMARLVRDLAAKAGKKVQFVMHGEDTELDRNVVEEIGDPLVHMIRNALDHGVEVPADRIAAGKAETGTVAISAYHKGSNIVIELNDDGRGIDTKRVLAKAIEKGLVSESQTFSEAEIQQFIFLPGFSTAAKITDISGRGVGMDVVKRNIERLRGSVEITSEVGKGSTFKILLPLTMAIIDGLVVRVGRERYILPTTSVRLALRPRPEMIATIQGRTEVMMFRDKTIPIVRLHRHLAPEMEETPIADGTVVMVDAFGRTCGLLVDEMVSKQEVVIKSLGSTMANIPGVAGGAILGDGNIALILDPATLLKAV